MRNFIIVSLFLLGIFLPTSLNYTILVGYVGGYSVALCLILFLWKIRDATFPVNNLVIAFFIMFILLIATWTTPLNDYSLGALLPITAFVLIFCLNLNEIKLSRKSIKLFNVINVFFLVSGMSIVLDVQYVKDIFLRYYNDYYQNLLPNMFRENKPVLFFSSHSRGAFHLFLFFFASFVAYKHLRRRVYLLFCVGYIVLLLNLKSNTAYLFLVVSLIILVSYLFKGKLSMVLLSLIPVSVLLLFYADGIMTFTSTLAAEMQYSLGSNKNGILGRFGDGGQLVQNLEFIKNNPFRPVGLGYSENLFFSDNGMVLYTLRGTVVLTILIYLGLYWFLRRNLEYNYQIYTLFFAFLLMDLAAPALTYFRTLFILPFLIVIIRKVSNSPPQVESESM